MKNINFFIEKQSLKVGHNITSCKVCPIRAYYFAHRSAQKSCAYFGTFVSGSNSFFCYWKLYILTFCVPSCNVLHDPILKSKLIPLTGKYTQKIKSKSSNYEIVDDKYVFMTKRNIIPYIKLR